MHASLDCGWSLSQDIYRQTLAIAMHVRFAHVTEQVLSWSSDQTSYLSSKIARVGHQADMEQVLGNSRLKTGAPNLAPESRPLKCQFCSVWSGFYAHLPRRNPVCRDGSSKELLFRSEVISAALDRGSCGCGLAAGALPCADFTLRPQRTRALFGEPYTGYAVFTLIPSISEEGSAGQLVLVYAQLRNT